MKTIKYLSILFVLLPVYNIAQWYKVTNNLPNSYGYAIDAVKNCAVVGKGGNVYKTNNKGESWIALQTPEFNMRVDKVTDISIIDSLHFWAATESGRILSSSDGGTNWQIQFENSDLTKFMNYIEMFDLNNGVAMGDAPDFLGIPSDSNKALFLRTTDGGNNWQIMENNTNIFASGNLWRRIDFVSLETGFFYENFQNSLVRGVMKTTDGGDNWNVDSSTFGNVLKFYDEKLGLIFSADQKGPILLKTYDGALTWSDTLRINMDWLGDDIEFAPNNPAKIWVIDDENLIFSNDTGNTWTKQTIGGQFRGRDIVFIDEHEGWILGDYGVFYTNNGGITSVVSENEIINDYKLHQNFPNPFNPTTTINYSIPINEKRETENVKLIVYDVLGRKIQILVNKEKQPGNYEVIFDASNISNGVYFYTLTSGNFTETKKMILLK